MIPRTRSPLDEHNWLRFCLDFRDLFPEQQQQQRTNRAQAGLYSGLAAHRVDDAFKVEEYDADGKSALHLSTLDEFRHFWELYVDFGLGLFTLTNAGVRLDASRGVEAAVLVLFELQSVESTTDS